MKALQYKGVGKIAVTKIKNPKIQDPKDVIVKLTMSTICGTDLHVIRGTMPGYKKGRVLGHEGVGIIEQKGDDVKNFSIGERVIVPATIACGYCEYCKKGFYSQCDNANPNGPQAGTAFYGSPEICGGFDGMQAEKVRVPFADASLIKIPDNIKDIQVILLSDILPTSFMAVENASPQPEDTVAVFGCGIVGQLAIACLMKLGVKKVFAIDKVASRLKIAEKQGAHPINFNETNPVEELRKLTDNKGPTKIIDAVGIDANHPSSGWFTDANLLKQFKKEVKKTAPKTKPDGENWHPGNGPSQVFRWAEDVIAKTGIISVIGVYTELLDWFSIGKIMEKNVTVTMGNCNHRHYIPKLLEWVKSGEIDLVQFITKEISLDDIVDAYKRFDKNEDGWLKVAIKL